MTVAAAPPARIEARGWGLRHPGRRAWALRDLDLTLEPGERVLLLGASGAGKSTLLTAIAGLVDPAGGAETDGSLRVDGRDPRAARERSGMLFQDPESQIVMGRCGDDVAFGLENRCVPTDDIWPRVDAALADVAFPYGRDHPTHALSGGEQQRLALAGVLALRPGLLLLDEPTANLDADGAATLRSVLAGVLDATGATLLLVEHRVEEAVSLIDRVVVLGSTGVVADGTPDAVFAARGAELADAGVWVPGHEPPAPPRRPRPPADPLVVADSVSFRYPGSDADALTPVDVEVRSSEALAVVGPNGAGKSTLALMLAGLLAPTTGSVVAGSGLAPHADRRHVARWPAQRLVRNMGTVFQDPEHQFLASTVRDEMLIGPRYAGLPAAEAARRADELLDRLRLAHLAAANPYTLSGGEKRRLSVATALATAPRLLILDEPTFGQDRRTWGELVGMLADLRDEGRGVCFVTHDRPLVEALADRTLSLPVAA